MTSDNLERVALIEQLRKAAERSSEIRRSMAEDKSLRNSEGRHRDLYMWPTPEQTLEGRAATALEALSAIPVPSPMGEERAREILAIECENLAMGASAKRIRRGDTENWLFSPEPAIRAIQAAVAEADEWRRVVIDALVVSHIYRKEHDSDPRLALNELLCWERVVALDPKVSEDAAKLVAEETERCASFADQWSQPEAKYLSAMQGLTDAEHSIAQQTAEGIATAIRKGVA